MSRRKKWLLASAAAVLLLVAAGGAFVAYRLHESRNIVGNPTVQFTSTAAPPPPPPKVERREGIVWPTYGYDSERLRNMTSSTLKPTLRMP